MMSYRILNLLVGFMLLNLTTGCEAPAPEVDAAQEVSGVDSDRVARLWSQSCALCHATGVASAPLAGNKEQWAPRLATGKSTLLKHTIEGYNNMPPLGYCMACTEQDFSALIDLMAGESRH